MKVGYFVNDISDSGGVERIVSLKANYLVEQGIEVVIFSWNIKKEIFYPLHKDIKIINLNKKYYSNFVIKQLVKIFKFFYLKRYVKNNNLDILITTGFPIDILFLKLQKYSKIIYECHVNKYALNLKLSKLGKGYRFLLDKFIFPKFDKIVVLTEADLREWKLRNIVCIPNFLTFDYRNLYYEFDNNSQKMISVGRLEKEKNFEAMIEIWKNIVDKYPKWILEIYGEGSYREKLTEKIKKLELEKNIFLKGKTKNIEKHYKESYCYLMTSLYEGFGMVLIEAMACGLPIISFNCPHGPKEIVKNNIDGFLIEQDNKEEMINKILFLIQNREVRNNMSRRAHINVEKYEKENIMKKWLKLFKELQGEN